MIYDFDTPDMPKPSQVPTADEARNIAIDWQSWLQDAPDLSYGELSAWQNYFEYLAQKFNLTDEFRENGII